MKSLNIIFILVFGFLAACATTTATHKTTSTTTKKHTPIYKRALETNEEKNNSSPALPLVSDGMDSLKNNNLDQAEWNFEQAINLDPDYGPGYYWLARVRYKLEQMDDAAGLLDKAAQLLKDSQIWLKRIEEFRDLMGTQGGGR